MLIGYGTPFHPSDISGLIAWFDMQDAASYTSSTGNVTAIVNKASGVLWTEATNPPAYSATGLNGLPAMVGDHTAARIISSEAAVVAAMADNGPATLLYAAQTSQADDAAAVWGVGNSGFSSARTKRYGLNTGGTGQYAIISVDDAGAGVNLVSTASITDTSPHVTEFFHDTSVGTILNDGAAVGANGLAYAPSTTTPNRCALLCRPDSAPDQFWFGPVGEVVLYNRVLTTQERSQLRQYMGSRWGIIVLP